MRLIDADALMEETMERYCNDCERRKGVKNGKWKIVYSIGDVPCRACGTGDMIDELENAPTIEPERKKGRWERKYLRPGVYADTMWHCSVCDGVCRDEWANLYSHCPNCGADLRGGEDELRNMRSS